MAEIENSNLYHLSAGTHNFLGACVVLVRTEWNAKVIDALEEGCRKILAANGVIHIITVTVPGAIEIPFAVKAFYEGNTELNADAFIALGCVIKGDTPHFDYVCRSVTDGVTQLNLSLKVPVIFGVLTVDNQQQAEERIGGKHGHKGEEAAITALKMIALNVSLKN